MWKKPFKSRGTILKTSDRRKLKEAIIKCYPQLPKEALDDLIPQKGDSVLCAKVQGTHTLIYSVDDEPMFFDVDSRSSLFPTVYALWKLPSFMPYLVVHPNVFQFLARGADLMLAGVAMPSPGGFDLKQNTRMAVVFAGSLIPVAVGTAAQTLKTSDRTKVAGKALFVNHLFGDQLWAAGSKSLPPDPSLNSPPVTSADEDLAEEELAKLEAAQTDISTDNTTPEEAPSLPPGLEIDVSASIPAPIPPVEAEASSSAPTEPTTEPISETPDDAVSEDSTTTEEMDSLIRTAFLQALKRRLKDKDLPMLASTFWAEYCIPCRPKGSYLNLKRSTWKKVGIFLEEQAREGVIAVATTDGVTKLVAVVRDSPALVEFRTLAVSETAESEMVDADEDDEVAKPLIQEYWTVNKKLEFLIVAVETEDDDEEDEAIAALKTHLSAKAAKSKFFTLPHITNMLWSYVSSRKLAHPSDPKKVVLDANLAAAFFAGKNSAGDSVDKKELAKCLKEKLVPIQVVTVNGEARVEKGAQVGNIQILVEARSGSKIVSRVQGLHHFGIDIKEFAKRASKKFASSAGTGKDATDHMEVLLQGNLEKEGPAFITQEFGIPSKYIKVEVKGNVKKKH